MTRLLVTGGAGFIGANFVHHWCDAHPGDRVVVIDALTYAGNIHSLPARDDADLDLRFEHGDIRDQDTVARLLRDEQIDTIVHFAAESHVDRSIHGTATFIDTNIVGTHSLLEAARRVWLDEGGGRPHRFHHVSTDEVYGSLSPDAPRFCETSLYAPNSPYAASKAAADHLVRAYHHTFGLAVSTSNCSNNYGPYQFPEKLVPLAIVNCLLGRAIPVYGDGLNVRDWLHVSDHIAGIELILERGEVGETYNLGGDNEQTNIALVESLCRMIDEAFAAKSSLRRRFPTAPSARGRSGRELLAMAADRPGHDRRYAIDAGKARRELGYQPQRSFDSGLLATVRWYLDNERWWRAVMDESYRQWVETQYGSGSNGRQLS